MIVFGLVYCDFEIGSGIIVFKGMFIKVFICFLVYFCYLVVLEVGVIFGSFVINSIRLFFRESCIDIFF